MLGISYKESLALQKQEIEFLNTLNLTPLLTSGKDIYDLMEEIEDKYGNLYEKESFIFNCMDSYDFVKYLKDKYKLHIIEKTSYQIF